MNFKQIIEKEKQKKYYKQLKIKIDQEYEHYTIYPSRRDIFKCLNLTPYDKITTLTLS